MICVGQRASSTRASPRLTYHLRICVDASDSGLPDRRSVCSQTLPSFHQRRSIIHVGPACQQMADWSVFILALHGLLMFIFNYKQEDNNGRIIKKEKKENIWTVSANSFEHLASIHLESITRNNIVSVRENAPVWVLFFPSLLTYQINPHSLTFTFRKTSKTKIVHFQLVA